MFMISKFMYDAVYSPREYLKIIPYEEKNHISNFYYFRLGARDDKGKPIKIDKTLTIPKNGFTTVWSLEEFTFGERVLGLFGNLSALVGKGLQLVHSPSIDPGFKGSLALGIKNNTSDPVDLAVGDRIGKILFFDVSDTIINAEEFLQNVLKQKELEERRRAAETMFKAYGDIMKGS
jgi:deoxycytidine triphosphate deaminase